VKSTCRAKIPREALPWRGARTLVVAYYCARSMPAHAAAQFMPFDIRAIDEFYINHSAILTDAIEFLYAASQHYINTQKY
jgi:hypothetical protein